MRSYGGPHPSRACAPHDRDPRPASNRRYVGITATQICWLHTHDTSGIIHIEADDDRRFTLGDFFAVWGQPLGRTGVAGERVGANESIQATINTQTYAGSPETIVLHEHDDVDLQLGPPFVQIAPYAWPQGY